MICRAVTVFAAFSTQNLFTFELLRFLADLPAGLAGSAAANGGDERTGTSGNFEAWNKTVNNMYECSAAEVASKAVVPL